MGETNSLLGIYHLMTRGEITQDEVADTLGFTPREFRYRLQKWGPRLPILLATLDKIKVDEITRQEAADILGVSTREVNKLQESWNVTRPLKQYLVDRAEAKIKWEIYKKYAIDFIAGGMEFQEMSEATGLSTRQARRWVSGLLMKHYEMPYKDLLTLSGARRKRLADEIEVAENLEVARQQVLKSIADGKESMQTEAIRRVLAERASLSRRINDDV